VRAKIASSGETYVVGMQTPSGYSIRRLSARTGEWIDSQPVILPGHTDAELASNGVDALAISLPACDATSFDRCLVTTRIPMSSAPPAPPLVTVHVAAQSADPRAVSNGYDYLVAWSNPQVCLFPCGPSPANVYAVRLRADGTAIDAMPLVLDNFQRFPGAVAVAWAGGRYLVAWTDSDGLRGTRVTPEGAISDRDAGGGGVLLAGGITAISVRAAGFPQRFVVLFRKWDSPSLWQGVAFASDPHLSSVVGTHLATLVSGPQSVNYNTLAAAVRDGVLALAYDRVGQASAGGAARAFLRLFSDDGRHRSAGR
jgi:hypothetical protein